MKSDRRDDVPVKPGFWLDRVRERRPLVHNITNLVVNNMVANALLGVGASPVMAYAPEEVGDMAKIAQALALNMGTLTRDVVQAMLVAGRAANETAVPVIFDPVGVGATPYRNETAHRIAEELDLAVLRGNQGEVSVFLGLDGAVRGVDSVMASDRLPGMMMEYANGHATVIVATGAVDYVTDGLSLWRLTNGHPYLSGITGSGCMLTALIGAFIGAAPAGDGRSAHAEACVAAITVLNVAAERAAERAAGPGTFQAHLFDSLYHLTAQTVDERARIDVLTP